jgi:serine-type D-Ala-D-Ala carboxypeptidase
MTSSDVHLRAISEDAVADRIVSGLTILIGREGRSYSFVVGQRQIDPRPLPVTHDTLWDLASLTKPLLTSILCMTALEQSVINLDEVIQDWPQGLDPARGTLPSVRHVLSHSAGYPAHRPLHAQALALDGSGAEQPATRAAVLEAARQVPLAYPPGTGSVYSDIGFILLGDFLERRLGKRLDELAASLFAPLGIRAPAFRPVTGGSQSASAVPIAATERCPVRKRILVGEVHDLNAYAMGGVAGHAGLFGEVQGTGDLAHALCAAYRGSALRAGQRPLVDREVLRQFWTPAGVPGSTWRLGWDGPAQALSLAGDLISRAAVGHLAFTGCSLWIDPERETFVLVLSNRVHPEDRHDPRFPQLRRTLNDAALTAVGYVARG